MEVTRNNLKIRAAAFLSIGLFFLSVTLPFSISLHPLSMVSSVAYAFTCPSGDLISSNSDGTFTCRVNISEGETQDWIYNADGTFKDTGNTQVTTGGPTATLTPTGDTVCDAKMDSWAVFFNISCWGPLLSGVIAGALVYITSSILTIAGVLFNWVLYATVLQFGQLINCGVSSLASGCSSSNGIITNINIAWSVFRDLSNIVIIGMFTFIAIATILGSVNYGAKKLISRVLIVAVLINFSLLFTKIVIDFSNFMSVQFYNAAQSNDPDIQDSNPSQAASGNAASTAQNGIAGAFMKYAGVQGLGDTSKAVFNIGKNPQGGAWWGLLLGVITALLYFVAAIVLFYGSFLLISRAILMIFLMITASIAFASYLVPTLSDGNYGFRAWSQILFKNAIFAPLLMVLLWITLVLAQSFSNTTGTLGSAISDPSNPLGISALFGYIIVIGLLYASFRISSSFASTVGGLNFSQGLWDKFAGGSLNQAGKLPGMFGQQTFGRFAYRREQSQAKQAQSLTAEAARLRSLGNTVDAKKLEAAAEKKARSSVRYGSFGGTYKKNVQERAKKVAEVVEKARTPAKEVRARGDEAEATRNLANENATKLKANLAEEKGAAGENAKVLKAAIEREIQANPALKETHEKNQQAVEADNTKAVANIEQDYAKRTKELNDEMRGGGADEKRKQEIQQQLLRTEESKKSEMRHQSERVERARQAAMVKTATSDTASDALKLSAQYLEQSHEKMDDIQQRIDDAEQFYKTAPTRKTVQEAHADTVTSLTEKASKREAGFIGRMTGKDTEFANAARKKIREDNENKRLKQTLNTQLERSAERPDSGGQTH